MYAVIRTGGKQYKCEPGSRLTIEKLDKPAGEKFEFDQVLMLSADDGVKLTAGELSSVKVVASVVEHFKDDKVIVFKYKNKSNYKRFNGHRQNLTKVKIEDITWPGKKAEPKSATSVAETSKAVASAPKVAAKKETVKEAAPKAKKAEKLAEPVAEEKAAKETKQESQE